MKKRKSQIILTPAQVVRELRTKHGWTLNMLSEVTGIAVSNLSNIESARSRLGEERALLLAEAFGVKPEFILFPNGYAREDLKEKLLSIKKKREQFIKEAA